MPRPSPNWKACTATWRVMPTRSAMGTIRGITMAAWPEPEGTRTLMRTLMMTMKPAPKTEPIMATGILRTLTMVSMTLPLLRITATALAKPVTREA